jgi:signal transduction histidine kinase
MSTACEKRLCSHLRELLGATPLTDQVLADARRRSELLAGGISTSADARILRAAAFVGGAIGATAPERPWHTDEISALVAHVAADSGVELAGAERELLRRALQAVEDAGLPGLQAIRAILSLLKGFTGLHEGSLWTMTPTTASHCLVSVGADEPSRRMRAAARETLRSGRSRLGGRGLVHSLVIARWDRPVGALVFRARAAELERVLSYATELQPALGTALERATVLARNVARERLLQEASEKRSTRLAYDIHDGPLQDLAALSGDVRLLRRQVERGLLDQASPDLVLGRLDDLEARLRALDGDLRAFAVSLDRATMLDVPLGEAVRRQVAALGSRLSASVRLNVRGDDFTPSQRYALLALVREGLLNAQEHGRASRIRVRISAGPRRTVAIVEDDGRGFDVESTLQRAAQRGRLGLAGLAERIRMLGGTVRIESSPGGPTRLSAILPHWENEANKRVRAA